MRRLNVLPVELAGVKAAWWRQDPTMLWGFRGCTIFVGFLGFLLIVQNMQLFFYERYHDRQKEMQREVKFKLFEQEQRVTLVRSSLDSLAQEQDLLDKKLGFLRRYQTRGPFWSQVLVDLSGVLKEKIHLKVFEGTEERVKLEGGAPDHQSISELIGAMGEKPRFRNVELNYAQAEDKDGVDTFRFEIASDIT